MTIYIRTCALFSQKNKINWFISHLLTVLLNRRIHTSQVHTRGLILLITMYNIWLFWTKTYLVGTHWNCNVYAPNIFWSNNNNNKNTLSYHIPYLSSILGWAVTVITRNGTIGMSKQHTVFTLSIRTPQLLTIYVLKFLPVQFTTRCYV